MITIGVFDLHHDAFPQIWVDDSNMPDCSVDGQHFISCVFSSPDPEIHPQNEEYWGHVNPIGPRACYDEGKRVAETLCYAYNKQVSATNTLYC